MKKAFQVFTRILALLFCSFITGFLLSHLVSDVLFDHEPISWLWSASLRYRDRFAPSIAEPDDLDGLYLIGLVSLCWLSVIVAMVAFIKIIRFLRARSLRNINNPNDRSTKT
jgi:hypothetical protein